jgi:hypothetical protein
VNPLVERMLTATKLDRQLERPSAKVARFIWRRFLGPAEPKVEQIRLGPGEATLVTNRAPMSRRARRAARRAGRRRAATSHGR